MSNVNIMRAVDNIKSGISVYTPLVEVIVNGIDAVEEAAVADGVIEVTIHRSPQGELDEGVGDVVGFTVQDNGIGFTPANRESFDTLYTTYKIGAGGKGFGRFTFLKYFDDVRIDSVFNENAALLRRTFRMGKETELIVDEDVKDADGKSPGTVVTLTKLKGSFPEKSLRLIARSLVEKLLPFFISERDDCPTIFLREADGSEHEVLNDYLTGIGDALIVEDPTARLDFILEANEGGKPFVARVFKLYSSKARRSKISLVAHRREVTSTSLHHYIPEFSEEFFDVIEIAGEPRSRNFVVGVYVFSEYLDEHVDVERSGFQFQKEADLLYGISQREIEVEAATAAKQPVEDEVSNRKEKKERRVQTYVRESAPWYASALREADLSAVPYKATDEEIELHLHRLKYAREVATREQVRRLLESEEDQELHEKAAEIVREVSESSRSELVHYVALRRAVLDIFGRALEVGEEGRYAAEDVVHDIIFPRRGDIDRTAFEDHNLWIIDERLNFTEYLSSDIALDAPRSDRPDLLAFGRRIGFRGENEPSNPVIIFELKRPQRDDFVNPSAEEDPVQQIVRYVRQIREGKYLTPRGREINVSENTPFYGYVVCDLTPKVRDWAEEEKDFKPMPDRLGFFRWHGSLNLYLEVLSWDKILKDATDRNRAFFHKLGIL